MAKAPAGNGANHNNSATACPNLGNAAHTSSTASAKWLTRSQVRAALAGIDVGPGSQLHRSARYRAWTAGTDADDLLQEALLRAMTSRSCPANIRIECFLMGVMRSIANAIIAKRERERDLCDLVAAVEKERAEHRSLSPIEEIDLRDRARASQDALDAICRNHTTAAKVIDGIDQGFFGKALARFAGTSQDELANVRRLIKRRAENVCAGLEHLDNAA